MSEPRDGVLDGAGGHADEVAAMGRKLGLAIYVVLKSASLYDLNNRFWDRCFTQLEEVVRWHFGDGVGKPLSLTSIEKALFFNGALVRMDAGSYGAMRFVSRAFEQLGIEELAITGPIGAEELRPLVALFREAIRARSGKVLLESTIPALRFRKKTERDVSENDGDKVDPKLAVVTAYASAVATCVEFRTLFLGGGNPVLVRLKRAAQELVTAAIRYPDLLVGLTQLARTKGTAAGHMTNSAAYALLLSRKLELPRRSYGELALNAMLAPLGVAAHGERTSAASAEFVGAGGDATARISAAVAMMKRYGALARPALVRSAIVHERSLANDPSGQVYRLGMKPHLFSRVIAVAAAYDLACQTSLPDEALRQVVAQARQPGPAALDHDVVALLSELLGLYPVGSTVRLSDGSTAVVVQAPRDPSRRALPLVRVVSDVGGRLVDLSDPRARLQIVGTTSAEAQSINVTSCFLL